MLVQRYQRRVYGIAFAMLHNPTDAMDATQEAFIKVHRYLPNFQGASSFYTWLYRIVVNISIDQIRRGRSAGGAGVVEYDDRMDHEGRSVEGAGGAMTPHMLGSNPSKAVGRRELLEHIHQALESLPAYHRAVIVMRELEGMSYSEMARVMNVSKGTIMSRLFHARKKMQSILREYLQDDVDIR